MGIGILFLGALFGILGGFAHPIEAIVKMIGIAVMGGGIWLGIFLILIAFLFLNA